MPGTQIDVGIVIKAVDKASAELAKAQESLKGFGDTAKEEADALKKASEAAVEAAERHKEAAKTAFFMGEAFKEVGRGASQMGSQFKSSAQQWGESWNSVREKVDAATGGFSKWIGVAMMGIGTVSGMVSGYQKFRLILDTVSVAKAKNTAATLAETGATTVGTGGILAHAAASIQAAGAKAIHTAANWLHTASQWAVNVAMYACPIVWIIALIVGLIAIIVLLVQNWDKVAKAFGDFGAWVKKGLGDAGNSIHKWCGEVSNSINKTWEGTKGAVQGAWDFVSKGFWDMIGKAFNWGQELMEEFVRGIKEGMKWLQKVLGDIGNRIWSFLGGNSPPKEGPLSNIDKWGHNLISTYSLGMLTALPKISETLSTVNTTTVNNRNVSNNMSPTFYISGVDEDRIADKVIQRLSEALG